LTTAPGETKDTLAVTALEHTVEQAMVSGTVVMKTVSVTRSSDANVDAGVSFEDVTGTTYEVDASGQESPGTVIVVASSLVSAGP